MIVILNAKEFNTKHEDFNKKVGEQSSWVGTVPLQISASTPILIERVLITPG